MSRMTTQSRCPTLALPAVALRGPAVPCVSQFDHPDTGMMPVAKRPALQASALVCGRAASN
jgi:hypothetical protein